jgi:PhnB protein
MGPRNGYRSVNPRIVVDDPAGLVEFLRLTFDASGDYTPGLPAEILIGDSMVMVSPSNQREVFLAFLYVYVDDADATHTRAVEAGAQVLEVPFDTPYGDRRSMVRGPFGNIFQIAHVV